MNEQNVKITLDDSGSDSQEKFLHAKITIEDGKIRIILPLCKIDQEANFIQEINSRTSFVSCARTVTIWHITGTDATADDPAKVQMSLALKKNDLSPLPDKQERLSLSVGDLHLPINLIDGLVDDPNTDPERNKGSSDEPFITECLILGTKIGDSVTIYSEDSTIKAVIEQSVIDTMNTDGEVSHIMIVKILSYSLPLTVQPVPNRNKQMSSISTEVDLPVNKSENSIPISEPEVIKVLTIQQEDKMTIDTGITPSMKPPMKKIIEFDGTAKIVLAGVLVLIGVASLSIVVSALRATQPSQTNTTASSDYPPEKLPAPLQEKDIVHEKEPDSVDEQDFTFLPMTSKNLEMLFGQSNTLKVYGKISGRTEPNKIGISCANPPRYNSANNTTDVSECLIALPQADK